MTNAEHHDGSWWLHWNKWLLSFNPEEQREPFSIGNEDYPVLGLAPGNYVKQTLPVIEDIVKEKEAETA